MASSVSGQDESNPALSLATRAGKMELSCSVHKRAKEELSQYPAILTSH